MDDMEYYNQLDNEEDRAEFRKHLSYQTRHNRRNPQRYDCPTCGEKDAISHYEKSKGYHCVTCTRQAEQGW